MAKGRTWASGLAAMGLLLGTGAGAEELVDGIAAQVGADIVLISEVQQLAGPYEAELQAAGAPPEQMARLRADVLEGLVERKLIAQLVKRSELDASEAEIDHAVGAIASENGLTAEQLRSSVEAQGLSFAAYRAKLRGEIEHNKVLQGMVASRVRVEEAELRALFDREFQDQPQGGEEVHLRHLLIPFQSEVPAQQRAACQQAESARARIGAGADFGALASKLSPVSPERGGDLGWIHAASLASWMGPAVAELAPGETSPVLRTPFGCNLLQLVDRRVYQPISFEQARQPLHGRLFNERMQAEYVVFIERLRQQTYIERKGLFADATRLGSGPDSRPGASLGAPAGGLP